MTRELAGQRVFGDTTSRDLKHRYYYRDKPEGETPK